MNTFRKKVYEKLQEVPRGNVVTYKILANAVGSKAYRAVGTAMKNNKDPENIPCYRVVCSTGFVGQYNRSIKEKIRKLKNDRILIEKNKIKDFNKYLYTFSEK